MGKIIIISILVLLIIAVVYDFLRSRNRNKEKFGSDFLFDTINVRNTEAHNRPHLPSKTSTQQNKLKSRLPK